MLTQIQSEGSLVSVTLTFLCFLRSFAQHLTNICRHPFMTLLQCHPRDDISLYHHSRIMRRWSRSTINFNSLTLCFKTPIPKATKRLSSELFERVLCPYWFDHQIDPNLILRLSRTVECFICPLGYSPLPIRSSHFNVLLFDSVTAPKTRRSERSGIRHYNATWDYEGWFDAGLMA